jgi:hypothetical protein
MSNEGVYARQGALIIAVSCIALSSIGGADSIVEKRRQNIADQELFFAPVPKAVCGPGDKPETDLQGQVSAALRASGFQGFSCNLQLIGQVRGEGASWQNDEYREGRGRSRKACAYHGTASPETSASLPGRTNLGTRAIDITNPAAPVTTAYLTTKAMLYPHESLKVNDRRQLLAADRGDAGPEFDLYDVGGDCRYPQLLAAGPLLRPLDSPVGPIQGHEGAWAPDGLTYYGSGGGVTYPIDTTDTTKPRVITIGPRSHGLSISDDGTRGYWAVVGNFAGAAAALLDSSIPADNGLQIYDLSDIQLRRPNPQFKPIGSIFWKDGSISQHSIPITIKKKPYVVFVDEAASGGLYGLTPRQFETACAAGFPPFPMARIIDISDETKPKIVSKLMLETHDAANCDKVAPDIVGLSTFTYGSHYCSVDSRNNATTLACGYFNSGVRVFDIRDPIRPREIAYYNPAGTTTRSPGSNHTGANWVAGGPDWCQTQLHLDTDTRTIWTTCMDNGLLMLKFTHNAWPFPETTTPPGRQN